MDKIPDTIVVWLSFDKRNLAQTRESSIRAEYRA
jgi:hypothetical protein